MLRAAFSGLSLNNNKHVIESKLNMNNNITQQIKEKKKFTKSSSNNNKINRNNNNHKNFDAKFIQGSKSYRGVAEEFDNSDSESNSVNNSSNDNDDSSNSDDHTDNNEKVDVAYNKVFIILYFYFKFFSVNFFHFDCEITDSKK
jgi:hypothetical protein